MFKLEELDRRFSLLRRADRVLDVGAAPGSWSQFAYKRVGTSGLIVAVDLSELPGLDGTEGIRTIVGDVFSDDVLAAIAESAPFDAIISDAAPNTTGNRSVDTARSAALVEHVLALCESMLRPGGNMVAKVFQGGDEQALLAQTRSAFAVARLVKPAASRSESFETFLVGTGFRGADGRHAAPEAADQ